MLTLFPRVFGRVGSMVALSLAVLALAACGGAAQPATDAPQPTAPEAAAATAAGTTPGQLRAAPKFELPDTSGETVSLDSYMGNRNVVVVFYRGFW